MALRALILLRLVSLSRSGWPAIYGEPAVNQFAVCPLKSTKNLVASDRCTNQEILPGKKIR